MKIRIQQDAAEMLGMATSDFLELITFYDENCEPDKSDPGAHLRGKLAGLSGLTDIEKRILSCAMMIALGVTVATIPETRTE